MQRLKFWLGDTMLVTSDQMGIASDFKEAIALRCWATCG
jgi:hypothetical protein